MKKHHATMSKRELLTCPECGNSDRFVQIMEVETHLVNGYKDYIRLLDGIVDHYVCCDCGAAIEETARAKV